MSPENPVFAYHLLRSALDRFGHVPSELSGAEADAVRARAEKSFAMESRVLETPEAGRVEIPDGRLDEAFATIRERYETEAEFIEDLARNGLDEDTLSQALRREIVFDAVMNLVAVKVPEATPDDARDYYDAHTDRFDVPELRTVRQILVTVNPDFPDNERGVALERITAIAERLEAAPETFEDEVRKFSECPSALEGGLVGQVPRGKLFPEIDAVLFGLNEGEIGGPVETEVGFHLIRCDAVSPPRHLPFEEISDRLAAKLTERRRHEEQKAWLKNVGAMG